MYKMIKGSKVKVITIELSKKKQIIQARGFANRLPTRRERRIIENWVNREQLNLGTWHL